MTAAEITAARIQVLEELLDQKITVHGNFGYCTCPGEASHTKHGGERHFRIVGLQGAECFGHCFHQGCKGLVYEFNEELKTRLVLGGCNVWPFPEDTEPREVYARHRAKKQDPEALARVAKEVLPGVGDMQQWLSEHSPAECDGIHGFLRGLFPSEGDKVILFKSEHSQGQLVWHRGCSGVEWQKGFRYGNFDGCWFLTQPVTGGWLEIKRLETARNPRGRTRRAEENMTRFDYLLLESDVTDVESWCRVLVQLPMPIVSVVTSGSRSIHALVWVGAASRAEWEDYRAQVEPVVTKYGCDSGALRCVQLSRLPGCFRYGKEGVAFEGGPREQALLYFDPLARGAKTILERI